jgi:hypothetical protein
VVSRVWSGCRYCVALHQSPQCTHGCRCGQSISSSRPHHRCITQGTVIAQRLRWIGERSKCRGVCRRITGRPFTHQWPYLSPVKMAANIAAQAALPVALAQAQQDFEACFLCLGLNQNQVNAYVQAIGVHTVADFRITANPRKRLSSKTSKFPGTTPVSTTFSRCTSSLSFTG